MEPNGIEALCKAAEDGDFMAIRLLLTRNPALIRERVQIGWPPLHGAARSGCVQCIQLLLDHGTDVNTLEDSNRTNAVFEAANRAVLDVLASRGADLNHISAGGRVALDYAIQGKRIDVVTRLIELGANVNHGNKFQTMLQWAWDTGAGRQQILKALLEAGSDPNAQNYEGNTVLHTAVRSRRKNEVALLLAYGADPCLRNYWRISCFDMGVDDPEIMDLLEPYRSRLVPLEIKLDSPDELVQRLIAAGIVHPDEFCPCDDEEIKELERTHKVILPGSYKTFLKIMGNGCGPFLASDRWTYLLPDVMEFLGRRYFDPGRSGSEWVPDEPLSDTFFVFTDRADAYQLGFYADGSSNDPVIYGIEELDDDTGDEADENEQNDETDDSDAYEDEESDEVRYRVRLVKRYDSFWWWIQEMVEYCEFHAPTGYYDGYRQAMR